MLETVLMYYVFVTVHFVKTLNNKKKNLIIKGVGD
jgi:hypothetical protein